VCTAISPFPPEKLQEALGTHRRCAGAVMWPKLSGKSIRRLWTGPRFLCV
jgi:hypothetical protein